MSAECTKEIVVYDCRRRRQRWQSGIVSGPPVAEEGIQHACVNAS
jgi:hypothetical protein